MLCTFKPLLYFVMYRPFYSPKKVINPQPNDTPPTVKPALLGSAVDYFGLGLVTPLLPFFCTEFAGSVDSVGYVLSAQYLGVIFGSAAVGYLSDRIGRKNTLMIALAGDVIFFSLTGFVKTVPTMCVVRLFAGLFTPLAACIAWVQDAAGNDELARAKNQGYFGGSAVIGFMSGAAAGGILGYSSFTAMNCVCGAFALFALVYTFFSLEPTRPHSEQVSKFHSIPSPLTTNPFFPSGKSRKLRVSRILSKTSISSRWLSLTLWLGASLQP